MSTDSSPVVSLSETPVLAAGLQEAVWLTAGGQAETLPFSRAALRLDRTQPPLVCHMRTVARRLGAAPFPALDLLELFAFCRPAQFCLPTPRGLAEALGLPFPGTLEKEARSLSLAAACLLADLQDDKEAVRPAWAMAQAGWPWGPLVLAALGVTEAPHWGNILEGLRVWNRLSEWSDFAPEPPGESWPVEPAEARARLALLLGGGAEERPQQVAYAEAVSAAFLPRDEKEKPNVVLAEAGTGVGKTLGYVAPASVWAEKNKSPVWISTFTRNLQRQLDSELDRLYPDPAVKALKAVVRKGRENYLCLLNYEEAVNRSSLKGSQELIALGLMARWIRASRDGDMVGGDFPAWLFSLLGRSLTADLSDTRGECIYTACAHYKKCFIERSAHRAGRAEIVIANHALVMTQAVLGGEGTRAPARYVFDEGHHVFSAADSAFSAHLTGQEMADLRHWLLGAEGGGRSRLRGLKARTQDLLSGSEPALEVLGECLRASRSLPGPGWRQRLVDGFSAGPAEAFLARLHQQVYARATQTDSPYDLEAPTCPAIPGLLESAADLDVALGRLGKLIKDLTGRLAALLDQESENLDTATRGRIDSVIRALSRREELQIKIWRLMLKALGDDPPNDFVDWMGVERAAGRDVDLGLHRHWIDPTRPFAEAVLKPSHGAALTSATLCDRSQDEEKDRTLALARTGAVHLERPAALISLDSPFDYAKLTRVYVITDVNHNDPGQVSAAYRELFLASGGGALGLFTAIQRLRGVYERIAGALGETGIALYAQHIDELDTGTLIDIFRAEEDSCLLGSDAVRDGIDVPGRSLRLIVFDRVPWPRPDILFKARRKAFGGQAFGETLTRLKLKQAYGRLVRQDGDRGVFVLLDQRLPSRIATAFPVGVTPRRAGLAQAVAEIREFLKQPEG